MSSPSFRPEVFGPKKDIVESRRSTYFKYANGDGEGSREDERPSSSNNFEFQLSWKVRIVFFKQKAESEDFRISPRSPKEEAPEDQSQETM